MANKATKPASGAGKPAARPAAKPAARPAAKPVVVNPGTPAPKSGQYLPVKGGPEVTVPKGHRIPPTPKGGPSKLVDPTKNKSGK
ncbi:hypothetical protein [Micromonospora globbae]|uniref:Uncharacterized protein n=1 Tax=Micromonospora globbae TaxID=1894969 RepID=A0A420EYE7_9ACTN|nr:hypothetical protein [Micromonospora globbae]RKF25775.1 hypothetical protein D7I43_18450 [Micromonospora globbae]WTF86029.1 hypothetical protein OH732_31050 [Micromonospora globbae]